MECKVYVKVKVLTICIFLFLLTLMLHHHLFICTEKEFFPSSVCNKTNTTERLKQIWGKVWNKMHKKSEIILNCQVIILSSLCQTSEWIDLMVSSFVPYMESSWVPGGHICSNFQQPAYLKFSNRPANKDNTCILYCILYHYCHLIHYGRIPLSDCWDVNSANTEIYSRQWLTLR